MFYAVYLFLVLILSTPIWAEPPPELPPKSPKSNMSPSKSSFIEIKEIENSLHLAHEASVEELFTHFSKRPPNKRGIFAQKLFEDSTYIYWGKPVFKGVLFLERRGVEKLYKTSKSTLERDLPIYNKIWAHTLKRATDKAIRAYRKSQKKNEDIWYPTCQASLQKRDEGDYHIVIEAKTKVINREEQKKDNTRSRVVKQAQYTVILSVKDLSSLEIKPK